MPRSFADQLLVAEILIRGVAPVHLTYALVQILGKGFRRAIGDRFHHDFVVIIVLCVVRVRQRVFFQTAGHRKGADIVGFTGEFRCDEIRQQ